MFYFECAAGNVYKIYLFKNSRIALYAVHLFIFALFIHSAIDWKAVVCDSDSCVLAIE